MGREGGNGQAHIGLMIQSAGFCDMDQRLIYSYSRSVMWLGRVGSSSRYAIKASRDKNKRFMSFFA